MSFNRNWHFICVLFSVFLMATSCSDDFLNEPKNEQGLTPDVVFSSRSNADAYVAGMMRRYRSQYTTVDTGGLYSLFFARTIKGNDLIQSDNWYGFDYANDNREPNYRRTVFNWNFNYEMVRHANELIFGVNNSSLSEVDKKELIAMGKAIRAFHYFQLALEFAPNYTTNPNAAKLPLLLVPSVESAPASTTTEIYTQIKLDLTEAIADLPETRLGKSFINKSVANGFGLCIKMLLRLIIIMQRLT